jgi:hypothetical protein
MSKPKYSDLPVGCPDRISLESTLLLDEDDYDKIEHIARQFDFEITSEHDPSARFENRLSRIWVVL